MAVCTDLIHFHSMCIICLPFLFTSFFFSSYFAFSALTLLFGQQEGHCLLFATHAHTTTTGFAVVPRLCHLILVSLSTVYLELSIHTSTIKHNAATNQVVIFVKVDETFTTIWLSRSSEVRVKVAWDLKFQKWQFSNTISSAIFQPIKNKKA